MIDCLFRFRGGEPYTRKSGASQAFSHFLYALGIRHVGQRMARILALEYQYLNALKKADREELKRIPDIGPQIAISVADFFEQKENRKVIDRLGEVGVKVRKMPAPSKKSAIENRTFVFMG